MARQKGLEPPTLRTGIVPELTLVLREKRTIFAANQLKTLKIIETRYYFHIYSITPLPSPQVPLSKKKHGFYAIVRLSHDLFWKQEMQFQATIKNHPLPGAEIDRLWAHMIQYAWRCCIKKWLATSLRREVKLYGGFREVTPENSCMLDHTDLHTSCKSMLTAWLVPKRST